jgi:flagellar protein FlaG
MNELSSQFALLSPSQSLRPERSVASGKVSIESRQNTSAAALPGADRIQDLGPIDNDKLEKAVVRLNEYFQQVSRELNFSIDENSGQTVIKVIDTETNQTIRQIPSKELLELASHFEDGESLRFFDASA